MLFLTPDGEGAEVEGSPKRASLRFDEPQKRRARAQTFRAFQLQGFSLADIASTFGCSERTVLAELQFLRDHPDAGLLPWDDGTVASSG